MEIKRKEAFELLKEYVEARSLIKHCLAVEASMTDYAEKFDEDVETWLLAAFCTILISKNILMSIHW